MVAILLVTCCVCVALMLRVAPRRIPLSLRCLLFSLFVTVGWWGDTAGGGQHAPGRETFGASVGIGC